MAWELELDYMFQSTLPVWGGTSPPRAASCSSLFQSTLPVWGGTSSIVILHLPSPISIHPPRVGRDPECPEWLNENQHFNPPSPYGEGHCVRAGVCKRQYFNPPSPCGEGPIPFQRCGAYLEFQSTLPVWGGTSKLIGITSHSPYFNPPSPCGEGLPSVCCWLVFLYFNPPSPCGEGRQSLWRGPQDFWISIHPPRVGRDVLQKVEAFKAKIISIHPPRVGRDGIQTLHRKPYRYFNPPSPCGEGRATKYWMSRRK